MQYVVYRRLERIMGNATTSHPSYRIFHWSMREIPMYADMAKGKDEGNPMPVGGCIKISHQAATKAGPTEIAVLNQGFVLAKIRSPKDQ